MYVVNINNKNRYHQSFQLKEVKNDTWVRVRVRVRVRKITFEIDHQIDHIKCT